MSAHLVWWLLPLSLAAGLLAHAMSDAWFIGQDSFAVLAALLVISAGGNGLARGRAAASDDLDRLSALIVGENLIRFVLLAPLFLFDAAPIWFGIALLAGFAVIATPLEHGRRASTSTLGAPASTMLVAALIGLISYATMFSSPLLLGLTDVPNAAISALFLVATLARVPFVVTLGLLPNVAVHLESLVEHGEHLRIRQLVNRIVLGTLGTASLVALVALPVAESTVGVLLGTNGQFGGTVYVIVGASSIISLGSLLISMVMISLRQLRGLLVVWSWPVVAAAFAIATGTFTSIEVFARALLGAELAILLGLVASLKIRGVASSA